KKGLKPDSLKKLFSVYPKYKNHNKKGCDFQRNTNFSYSSQPLFYVFPAKLQKADLQVTLSSPSIVLIA
ncbi:hypothetical protein MKA62_13200, partial [[Clostridium] innocuum]|nr:hypothetical protein [[Clostridium] innocuum]MCR0299448.1 hypothetical protein [[Clostridium] innocuum]MCR0402541.1 hypothetical protein [[Clostridium] innocuum]MCR0509426.1 hypothetical protein [[Clostridium] innocuum]MCR0586060.1 hypothetical protein [[Clostridium] innocuum]